MPNLTDDQIQSLKLGFERHWRGANVNAESQTVYRECSTRRFPRFLLGAQFQFLFGWCLRSVNASRNDRGGWSVQMRWVKDPRHVWTLDTSKAEWTAYPAYRRMSLWTSLRMLWLLEWSHKVNEEPDNDNA